MYSLFSLSAQYQQLMKQIMECDEIDNNLMQSIENASESLEDKILNYTSIIKTFESEADAIKKAIGEMSLRLEKINNKSIKMKEFIKETMEKCDKKKISNPYHEICIKLNNPKVFYLDKSLIPENFIRKKIKEIEEPDAIEILKALKENIEIPGCMLVRETRIEIR